jgi:hypothetical protein
MKNMIIDQKDLNDTILGLLVKKYPEGYEKKDILSHKTDNGKTIKVVTVTSGETKYLVKENLILAESMADYVTDNYDDYLD